MSARRRDFLMIGIGASAGFAARSFTATHSTQVVSQSVQHASKYKGYVNGPYGQIHYYRQGNGPVLVLLHQSPVNGRMFERAMPHLAAGGVSAIAVDTPGYGNSDTPITPPSIREYAEALEIFLDELALKKVHLLGHHTGASIAVKFAAEHPNRVDSLILNGPPLFSKEELETLKTFEHALDEISVDGSHLQRRWQRRASFSSGWTDKEAMHRRVIDQLWAGDTAWYGHAAAFKYDMRADFDSLSIPTMILTNTGDDIYHLAQSAIRRRPDMSFYELEGGTHDIVDEQPEAWSHAVLKFISSQSKKSQ